MSRDNQEKWLAEFAQLKVAHPEIKVLGRKVSVPGVPHAAPQIEFGPWELAGAQRGTYATLRFKKGVALAPTAVPATWLDAVGREAVQWRYRVLNALGHLDSLLADMSLIEAFEEGAYEPEAAISSAGAGTPPVWPDLDESDFPEGAKIYRWHSGRERDRGIIDRAKKHRLITTGRLECEICGFDSVDRFGSHAEGFIEAHHTVPVSKLDGKTRTKLRDLALVCSNCHRMLHRGSPLPSVDRLRRIREEQANSQRPSGVGAA